MDITTDHDYHRNRVLLVVDRVCIEPVIFTPQYDADGNQTLLETQTGIWSVSYDAFNRPVRFTSQDETIIIESNYDSMGRRVNKKVTQNGAVILHQRYLYRGYLQIACIDMTRSGLNGMWMITWDPTQASATRPLALQKDGTWYCYGTDLSKNVTEVYKNNGTIATAYTYAPFGQVVASGSTTQPLQWSSEYYDTELGLVYYNYRHYNPKDGRWINRDPIGIEGGYNLYAYVGNSTEWLWDVFGEREFEGWTDYYRDRDRDKPRTPPPSPPSQIKLVYSAFCKQKSIFDHIIEGTLPDHKTSGIHDFDPNSKCTKCQCIQKLTVIMHGRKEDNEDIVIASWGDFELYESPKFNDISRLFVNINFCKECTLELRSCYLGESTVLKERLEKATNCNIQLYHGKVNAFFPF